MSRIGKQPVTVPSGVEVSISADNIVSVKGKKGELTLQVNPLISVEKQDDSVVVVRTSDTKEQKSLHGLYRSLISNMVSGVSEGFSKTLEIIGVGYRANMNGSVLEMALGYSHPYFFITPDDISIEVDTKSGKNTRIIVAGADKALVGQVAAKVRSLRAPEPYKGKGIRYLGEIVRRKAGKSAGK